MDLAEDANGELVFATEMGIARLNGTELEVVAMEGQIAVAIELIADGSLVMATVESAFMSGDGETWTDLGLDVYDYPFGYALSGVSAGQIQEHAGMIYVAWNDQLFVSDDDGASWSETLMPSDTASFAVSDAGIFAATWEIQPRHLFRSTNGGVDYEQISAREDVTGIFALPGGELLMTTYMSAMRSTDGGDSWAHVPGLSSINWPVLASHSSERNALVDQRGIYRLSSDGMVSDDSTSGEADESAGGGAQAPDAGGPGVEPDASVYDSGVAGEAGGSGGAGGSGEPDADADAGAVASGDAGAQPAQSATRAQDAGCGCRVVGQSFGRHDRPSPSKGLGSMLALSLVGLLVRARRAARANGR